MRVAGAAKAGVSAWGTTLTLFSPASGRGFLGPNATALALPLSDIYFRCSDRDLPRTLWAHDCRRLDWPCLSANGLNLKFVIMTNSCFELLVERFHETTPIKTVVGRMSEASSALAMPQLDGGWRCAYPPYFMGRFHGIDILALLFSAC